MEKLLYVILFFSLFGSSFAKWERLNKPGNYRNISNLDVYNNDIYITLRDNIYHTNDYGKHWKQVNDNTDLIFNDVLGICKNSDYLFAYSQNQGVLFPKNIYVTGDNGANWITYNDGLPPWKLSLLYQFYKNSEDVYAVTAKTVLKFDNINKKWVLPFDSTLPNYYLQRTMLIYQNKLYLGSEVYPQDITSGIIRPNVRIYDLVKNTYYDRVDTISNIWKYTVNSFAAIDSVLFCGTTGGIFVSKDEGVHWELKSEGLNSAGVLQLLVDKDYFYAIARYLGRNYVVYSTNKGENWNYNDNAESYPEPIKICPAMDRLIISTNDGLYSSTDSLETIISLLDTVLCGNASLDLYVDNNKLFTGIAYGNLDGIYESSDFGNNWIFKENNLVHPPITKIAVKDNFIFICVNYSVSYYSSDSGKTFKVITKEMGLPYPQVYAIKIVKDIVYFGTKFGIFYSNDWGQTWKELGLGNSLIFSLEFDGDYIFAGTQNNILWISSDKGVTWNSSKIPFNDYNLDINDIKVINNELFIGTTHAPNADSWCGKGIWVSKDIGKTWEERNNGIPDFLGVQTIEQYENYIFIGLNVNGGVYYSTDYGQNWQSHNRGLTNFMFNKLLIEDKYLFAATAGGVYRVPLSDFGIVGVDEVERKNYLYNYPPFPNPATEQVSSMIYWDLALDINTADIKIYDIYGKQVAEKTSTTLEEQGPYYGKLTWNCHGINPGVYLISINYGTEKKTIKVCVVE
ncbi:MAG: hypothetical protein A2X64_07290 [Ignavibacteria bacterium GWF2_33_9]|nr:MAG: hypothetical protein A2X64_07290 [Ignavibacteria bacterium GWF2_33_9]